MEGAITGRLLLTDKKLKRLSSNYRFLPNPVDDVEMFAAFDSMNITYYRIDTTKPLGEQKPVDAILHKVMYCS